MKNLFQNISDTTLVDNYDSTSFYYIKSFNPDYANNFEKIPFSEHFPESYITVKDTVKSYNSVEKESSLKFEFSIQDWSLIFIIFSFILLAVIKFYYKKYIKNISISLINYNYSLSFFKEKGAGTGRARILLGFIYLTNISLFAYYLLNYFDVNMYFDSAIFNLLCLTAIFIIIKYLYKFLNSTICYIFCLDTLAAEYNLNKAVINHLLGIILFPFVIGISFFSEEYTIYLIYSGLLAFVILQILRLFRLSQINIRNSIDIFYFFLYLCTLEVIPILIIIKTVIILPSIFNS